MTRHNVECALFFFKKKKQSKNIFFLHIKERKHRDDVGDDVIDRGSHACFRFRTREGSRVFGKFEPGTVCGEEQAIACQAQHRFKSLNFSRVSLAYPVSANVRRLDR